MHKKEKEITDPNVITDILKRAIWCHLAMSADDKPYVIPVNYGYFENALYIHCAPEGMKLDIIRKNPNVSFNVTLDTEYLPEKLTMRYLSVNGFGKALIIEDENEKRTALNRLTAHFGSEPFNHSARSLKTIVMIRIAIESLTGKISYY